MDYLDLEKAAALVTDEEAAARPMQKIVWVDGVIRFRENAIVRMLLDEGPFDLNQIALRDFSQEDREQFAQLIGYSVSGAGDLSYMSSATIHRADIAAEKLYARRHVTNQPKFDQGQRVTKVGENQEGRVQSVAPGPNGFKYNVKWDNGPTTLHDEADLRHAPLPPHYP